MKPIISHIAVGIGTALLTAAAFAYGMKERPAKVCTELGKHKAKAAIDAGKDAAGKLIKGVLGKDD